MDQFSNFFFQSSYLDELYKSMYPFENRPSQSRVTISVLPKYLMFQGNKKCVFFFSRDILNAENRLGIAPAVIEI